MHHVSSHTRNLWRYVWRLVDRTSLFKWIFWDSLSDKCYTYLYIYIIYSVVHTHTYIYIYVNLYHIYIYSKVSVCVCVCTCFVCVALIHPVCVISTPNSFTQSKIGGSSIEWYFIDKWLQKWCDTNITECRIYITIVHPFPIRLNLPQILRIGAWCCYSNWVLKLCQLKSNRRPPYPKMWFNPLVIKTRLPWGPRVYFLKIKVLILREKLRNLFFWFYYLCIDFKKIIWKVLSSEI